MANVHMAALLNCAKRLGLGLGLFASLVELRPGVLGLVHTWNRRQIRYLELSL